VNPNEGIPHNNFFLEKGSKAMIIRIDLNNSDIKSDNTYDSWGRELIADILLKEVDPLCHPYGEENKLIFAIGPLAGFGISSAGRLSVGSKSPLTRAIKEANAGGMAGEYLAKWGYKGIILEGKSRWQTSVIEIGEEIKVIDFPEGKNMRTGNLSDLLREKYDKDITIICVGPAGELGLAAAGIAVTDKDGVPSRYAARGGLGGVMGKKGVKAIVIKRPKGGNLSAKATDEFKEIRKEFHDTIIRDPRTGIFREYGTPFMVWEMQTLGGLPTANFQRGCYEKVERITAETFKEIIIRRGGKGRTEHGCMTGCIVKCSNVFPDEKGESIVSPLEYETIVMLGTNLMIDSLDEIADLNRLCNEIGLDTIEIGCCLGMLTGTDLISFGDYAKARQLIEEIEKNTVLGRVIGNGVETTARVFGIERVPAALGQGIPGYDPRAIKGMGVTYATSPMGADHTAGHTVAAKVNHHDKEGQIESSVGSQIMRAAIDSLGICNFLISTISKNLEVFLRLLEHSRGIMINPSEFENLGRTVLKKEHLFNLLAGVSQTDKMPMFMRKEELPPYNLKFDVDKAQIEEVYKLFKVEL
jgi:aldehyde:ferredoxin oxidoreductase